MIEDTQKGILFPLGLSSHVKKGAESDTKTRTRIKPGKQFFFEGPFIGFTVRGKQHNRKTL